jgi:hypothetical protein
VIVLIGILLALDAVVPDLRVGSLTGPLLLIALGVWIVWGVLTAPRHVAVESETVAIPLEGATEARVRIAHGAGRLRIEAGAAPDELASGSFGGGLDLDTKREGSTLDATLRGKGAGGPVLVVPWLWGPAHTHDWSLRLNAQVALALTLDTGASDARLDLTGLRVSELRLNTGASATVIEAPANAGHTRIDVRSGAASVRIRVPEGVAARIRVKGGLAGTMVDRRRFPRVGSYYLSPDYDTAANRIDVTVETAVGSIDVR